MASRNPAVRGWLVVLVLGVVAGLAGVALLGVGGAGKHTPSPTGTAGRSVAARVRAAPDRAQPAGLEVLHHWDRARAGAWASGDPARLRSLYVAGSAAGRADVALLRRYLARGLVVTGMRRQVVAARVLGADQRLMRLRVTDRLVGAVARRASTTSGASVGRALPRSQAQTRLLVLTRSADGSWRMRSVRPVSS